MKKRSLVLFVLMGLASCSRSSLESPYCKAISSNAPTLGLSVSDVYVYGTAEHGTMIFSMSCIRPVYRFYSFQESTLQNGAAERIFEFNRTVYGSPSRASGMFKIDAVLNIYPKSRLVELYDIKAFREISNDEAGGIIDLLRRSRK